jgi:hypothetical protein
MGPGGKQLLMKRGRRPGLGWVELDRFQVPDVFSTGTRGQSEVIRLEVQMQSGRR